MTTVINKKGIAMLMVVAVVAVICGKPQCATADAACDQQIQNLSANCYSYVLKGTPQTTPSTACCQVIKTATFDCVCSFVTPVIEAIVDASKVIYVAKYCEMSLPHGKKCGSATVP